MRLLARCCVCRVNPGPSEKWAFGREKCWMHTLPGRKHSSDGARCSISWNNFASDDIEQECRLFN